MDKKLFESLVRIGIESCPRPIREMRGEGWMASEDIADVTGYKPDSIRRKLNNAVKEGKWERARAKAEDNRAIVSVFREIQKD